MNSSKNVRNRHRESLPGKPVRKSFDTPSTSNLPANRTTLPVRASEPASQRAREGERERERERERDRQTESFRVHTAMCYSRRVCVTYMCKHTYYEYEHVCGYFCTASAEYSVSIECRHCKECKRRPLRRRKSLATLPLTRCAVHAGMCPKSSGRSVTYKVSGPCTLLRLQWFAILFVLKAEES